MTPCAARMGLSSMSKRARTTTRPNGFEAAVISVVRRGLARRGGSCHGRKEQAN
jgi:hypothetical protein